MATAEIKYQGKLRTEATHIKSGQSLITDAPTDNHGFGKSFSPTDLVGAALVSCMQTIIGIVAASNGFEVKGMNAEVTKVMGDNPRRILELNVDFTVEGKYSETQKRQIRNAAINCPVAKSLHPDICQNLNLVFKSNC